MEMWIGTSGYVYDDWVGVFYPPGTSSHRMFAYYTSHFPLVELNYTFYCVPAAGDMEKLARRAPPGFQFIVKLHQSFSHQHDLAEAKAFRQAVEVLKQEDRLLALLCQYPQRLHHGRESLARLEALAEAFAGYPLAVEFRHSSWARPDVPEWLHARGLHLVSVDVPDNPALYPRGLVQSSRVIYVRFHSRRQESWYASDKERYDYQYSDEELQEWLEALATRAVSADRALVLFNNCYGGQAAINAGRLRELVSERGAQFKIVPPFASEEEKQKQLF